MKKILILKLVLFTIILWSFYLFFNQAFAKINNSQSIYNWVLNNQKLSNLNSNIKFDWILIKYNDSKISKSTLNSVLESNWLEVKDWISNKNISLLKLKDNNVSYEKTLNNLRKDSRFDIVQPNFVYEIQSLDSNDTYNNNLWGLFNYWQEINSQVWISWSDISFDKAVKIYSWVTSWINTWVIVAVLDTWVAYNHPDLINQMWNWNNCKDENWNYLGWCIHWYDFADNDKNPAWETSSHWTHVAWTIWAQMNNWNWIIWVNPNAKIMSVRMWNNTFTTLAIIKSIDFANQNWAKIINASYGWGGWYYVDTLQYYAIKRFTDNWWIFVAAAWNNWTNNDTLSTRFFPASFWITNYLNESWYLTWNYDILWTTLTWITNLISVAAIDNRDLKASFTNYWSSTVNISAPWVSIYSTIIWKINIFSQIFPWPAIDMVTGWVNNNWWFSWGYLWPDISYPYSTWSNTFIEKQVDISSAKAPTLDFSLWCDAWSELPWLDDYSTDYLQLSFSTWWAYTEYAKYNYTSNNLLYFYLWGYYNNLSILLNDYKSSNFKFRFTWHTDDVIDTEKWCYIYSELKVNWADNWEQNSYNYLNGTSMASPHVSWLVSYLWSYKPNLPALDIKNAILDNWDNIASMTWITTTWKRINAYSSLLSLLEVWNITNFKSYNDVNKLSEILSGSYTNSTNPYFEWQDDVLIWSLSWYIFEVIDNSGTVINSSSSKDKYYSGFTNPTDWVYNFSLYEELINWKTWSTLSINNVTFDFTNPDNITNLTYQSILTWSLALNYSISWSWNIIDSWSIVSITFSWSNLSKSYSWILLWDNFTKNWINLSDITDWNIYIEVNLIDNAWNSSDTNTGIIQKETDSPTWSITFSSGSYINNLNTNILLTTSESWTYVLSWTGILWTLTWSISSSKNHNITLTWSNWIKTINYQITDLYWNVSPVYTANVNYDNISPVFSSLSHHNLQNLYTSSVTLTWVISDTNLSSTLLVNWISTTLSSTWFFSKSITLIPWLNSITISNSDLAWNNTSTWFNLIRVWNAPRVESHISGTGTITFDITNEFAWTSFLVYWTGTLTNILTWAISTGSIINIPFSDEETTYYYRAYSRISWYDSLYSDTWSITTPKNITIWDFTWSLTVTWSLNILDSTGTWVNFVWTWTLRLYSNSGSSFIDIPKFWMTISSLSWSWDWIIEAPHLTNSSWNLSSTWYVRINDLTYKIWSNNDSLLFSWWKVSVSLNVWDFYNGKIFKVYLSEDKQATFIYVSDCIVANWMCSFETDRFSEFTLLEPSTTDSTPNSFTLNSVVNAEMSTSYTSNIITITWMNTMTWITTSIWSLIINWIDIWLSWSVNSWSTVAVKLTSSPSYNTLVNASINVGWYSTTFSVTTKQQSTWWWGWGWGWGWGSSTLPVKTTIVLSSSWTTSSWTQIVDTTNILTWTIVPTTLIDYNKLLNTSKNLILKKKNWKEFITAFDRKVAKMSVKEIESIINTLSKINKNKYPPELITYLDSRLHIELEKNYSSDNKIETGSNHDTYISQLIIYKTKLSKTEKWKAQIKSVDKLINKQSKAKLEVLYKNILVIKSKINNKTNYKYSDIINYIEASIALKLWK